MDGLSAAASVISVIQLTQDVLTYVHHFKDYKKESQEVEQKIHAVEPTLANLKLRVDEAGGSFLHPGYRGLQQLDPTKNSQSPILSLKASIQGILDVLAPPKDWKRHIYKLQDAKWHWDRKKIDDIFSDIFHYCALIDSVFSYAHYDVSYDTNKEVKKGFADIEAKLQRLQVGQDATEKVTNEQLEIAKRQDAEHQREKRNRIAEWLSPFRFLARHQALTATCFPIGSKLLETDEFRAWVEGSGWQLYFHADAGAGKTYFSNFMIERLQADLDPVTTPVLYLYLDHKDQKLHTEANLYGSLLKQLIQRRDADSVPDRLQKMYDKTTERPPQFRDVETCLKEEIDQYDRIFVVADGLDECAEDIGLWLTDELPLLHSHKVSVVFTTRNKAPDEDHRACSNCGKDPIVLWWSCLECEADILEDQFDICKDCHDKGIRCAVLSHPPPAEPYQQLFCRMEFPESDIAAFVKHELNAQLGNQAGPNARASRASTMTMYGSLLKNNSKLQTDIMKRVTDVAQGHVIFAKLCLNALKDQRNVAGIRRVLNNLSASTDALYDDFMQRIRDNRVDEEKDLALKALPVLAQQQRPLTFEELQTILAVEKGDNTFNEDNIYDVKVYTESTKNLIVISDRVEDGRVTLEVRLFHSTLDAYLKNRATSFGDTHAYIAGQCLTYLQFEELAEPIDHVEAFTDLQASFPFVNYSALFWAEHVKLASETDSLLEHALVVMRNPRLVLAFLRLAWCSQNQSAFVKHDLDFPNGVTGLHLCAWTGLAACVDELIEDHPTPDVTEQQFGQTPLMLACRRKDVVTVSKLLDHGARADMTDLRGRSALIEAILYEQIEVAKLLIARLSVDVGQRYTIKRTKYVERTPLMIACSTGLEEVVQALLDAGTDVNAQDPAGYTALMLAIEGTSVGTVKALLERPDVDVGSVTKETRWSALTFAVAADAEAVILLLLTYGNSQLLKNDAEIASAFHHAFKFSNEGSHLNIIDLMLDLGANPKAVNDQSHTLLHMASSGGFVQYFKEALKGGVDIDARDKHGSTALHAACSGGHLSAVKTLIALGADMTIQNDALQTPVATAWAYQHHEIVQLLCEKGPASISDEAKTFAPSNLPIWSLARHLQKDELARVLKAGKVDSHQLEIETQNTALHTLLDQKPVSSQQEQLDVLKLLVEDAHLNVEAGNFLCRTPLHYAAYWGHTDAARYLLDHEASVDAKDKWGRTPLATALRTNTPSVSVISALLEEGADAHAASSVQWGVQDLFFLIVEEGSPTAIKRLLLTYGADRLEKNDRGQTGYDIALRRGDRDVLKAIQMSRTVLSKEPDATL